MSDIILKIPSLHPSQEQVLSESKRFNVLKNGRRWGKTTLAVYLAIDIMLEGFPVGYWCPTYKDLFEVWRELKHRLTDVIKYKNEQVNQIEILTGGKIDFWSMEDPNSGRGRKYKRAIIDEAAKARNFQESFDLTIRPTLVDLEGDVWIFSTPRGKRTYFQELFERKNKFDNWMSWQKGTKENPHIPPSEIEEARQQLDTYTFLQEFEGESIDYSSVSWAYAFKELTHTGKTELNPAEPLFLSFDFNNAPVTCTMWQHYANTIRCLQEFGSNQGLNDLCEQIKDAVGWENGELTRICYVTGDKSGWNKSELLDGNRTAYDLISMNLNLGRYSIQTPNINPNLLKSRELVNSILEKYTDILIDNVHCPNLIFDLKFVEADDHHQIVKDRKKKEGKADYLDGMRYYLNTYHQNFVRIDRNQRVDPDPEIPELNVREIIQKGFEV